MSTFGDLLTAEQLADELQATKDQLAQWRYMGRGPRFLKEGHFIRYRRVDVEEWLESRIHTRTDMPVDPGSD